MSYYRFFTFFLFCNLLNLNSQYSLEERIHAIDSLIENNAFKELPDELSQLKVDCPSCLDSIVLSTGQYADTMIKIIGFEIKSRSYMTANKNIQVVDDLNFYMLKAELNWKNRLTQINKLKCDYNAILMNEFNSLVNKAHGYYMSKSNLGLAGELIAKAQYYRLKFFKNICFNPPAFDVQVQKIVAVINWIEKVQVYEKYQQADDARPEWVKKGMTYEQYQEWWAQRLRAGSDYVGGACNDCGKKLYRGKRGGIYYINSNGNRTYVPR